MGINIVLLEKPTNESFAQLVYDKFLTINMTDYKRVMFMDGDMIPMTNLDYYFHLSDPEYTALPTLLKSNFIMASKGEPCNTGMFMVTPSKEAFADYIDIVRRQLEIAKTLPYPHFNLLAGWGHNFTEAGDRWKGVIRSRGKRWSFHAGHSDQGLMYYFTKYVRQDVTIALGDIVENWKPGEKDKPILESTVTGMLSKYQGALLRYQYSCNKPKEGSPEPEHHWRCTPPYDSTAHFMGIHKPWMQIFVQENEDETYSYRRTAARDVWFRELAGLNSRLQMGLDLDRWDEKYLDTFKELPLGVQAYHDHQIEGLELALRLK